MGLETGTFIDDLVSTNPVGSSDPKSQGDDHLRLIKSILQNTFPNAGQAFYFPSVGAAKTSNYTVVAADDHALILVDASAGAITLGLTASGSLPDGFTVYVLLVDSTNSCTIDASGAETINGSTTLSLTDTYESVMLVNDQGNGWYAVKALAPTFTASSTDTLTNKTINAANNTLSGLVLGTEVTGASTALSDTANITYDADTDASAKGWVIDEDNMASDSATKVPTQQSVKAYVDANGASVSGEAKAWVRFAFSGGTISNSYNVTSITDNGAGNWTVNLTTAFSSANYVPIASAVTAGGGTENRVVGTGASSSSAYSITMYDSGGTITDPDSGDVYSVAFGDQ